MKISPVIGTPTIPSPSPTGLAPEKIARLKAIAEGRAPLPESEKEEIETTRTELNPKRITMKTNRTVHRELPIEAPLESEVVSEIPQETVKNDTDVQANAVAEATAPLSPQLAALAKQRRALQIKEQQIAEREKALAGPSRADLESRIKAQPLSVLQELGVTYDQLTQEILSAQDGTNPKIHELEAKVKALEEGVDKKLSERDQSAERAVLTEMASNINRLCATGDDFEMIRETKQQEEVLGRIYDQWLKTGQVIDELEMMKTIESELVEEAAKYAKYKKVQGKLTPPAPLQPQPQAMRTLTNKDQAQPVMGRRQRAMMAAQGLLPRR